MTTRVGSTGNGERQLDHGRGGRGLSLLEVNCWYRRPAPHSPSDGLHRIQTMKTFLPLAAALLLVGCTTTNASADTYKVLSVGDGDTLTALSPAGEKTRIRLACVDAPESSQRPAGPAARAALQQLLPVGTPITLRVKATDRYGRTVAEVFDGGRNVNQALVGAGDAYVYWDYISGCDRNRYGVLEAAARSQRWGVWADPSLLPPWEYRACRRSRSC